jgi:hypothetical protein
MAKNKKESLAPAGEKNPWQEAIHAWWPDPTRPFVSQIFDPSSPHCVLSQAQIAVQKEVQRAAAVQAQGPAGGRLKPYSLRPGAMATAPWVLFLMLSESGGEPVSTEAIAKRLGCEYRRVRERLARPVREKIFRAGVRDGHVVYWAGPNMPVNAPDAAQKAGKA